MVCIIDDREDVWQGCGNLVQVKPYQFFRYTDDINAPPGWERNNPGMIPMQAKEFAPEKNEVQKDEPVTSSQKSVEGQNSDNIEQETTGEKSEEKSKEQGEPEDKTEENKETVDETQEKKESEEGAVSEKMEVVEEVAPQVKPTMEECPDEDNDDYLLYLEDILKRIHAMYYSEREKNENISLKDVIPQVRVKVLKGLHIAFSGLVPNTKKLRESRAYRVARAFGADVHQVRVYFLILTFNSTFSPLFFIF